MSHRAARATATPTALVASLGHGSTRGRSRKARHVSLPNPVERLATGRRRRRRRQQVMKLARNAGAVVSAVTFAAEMASAWRDIKGPDQEHEEQASNGRVSRNGSGRATAGRGKATASRSS